MAKIGTSRGAPAPPGDNDLSESDRTRVDVRLDDLAGTGATPGPSGPSAEPALEPSAEEEPPPPGETFRPPTPAPREPTDPEALAALGPAFPSPDDDSAPRAGTAAPQRAPQPTQINAAAGLKGSDAPTSARGEPTPRPQLDPALNLPKTAVPEAKADDLWAQPSDAARGWTITGQSQVTAKNPLAAADAAGHAPEYARRTTDVYGRQKKRQPDAGARLVCTAGADNGREFEISGSEQGIGRAASNDIVLSDPSVSREHARLAYDGNHYNLIDNRSGNGTFVNGQRVDRARVRSGDELGFGSTRFRFLEIGDVFKPVDPGGAPVLPGAQASDWRRHLRPRLSTATVGLGVMLSAALIVVLAFALRGNKTGSSPELAFQYYLEGVEAFKKHQWTDAEQKLGVALSLLPNHARSRRYLEAIGRERAAEEALSTARAARQAGDLVTAFVQAQGIRDSLLDSEAQLLLRTIDDELDVRIQRARQALDGGQAAEALGLLTPVQAIRPDRPDVLALLDRAHRASPAPQPQAPAAAPSPTPPPSPTPKAPPPASTPSATPPKTAVAGGRERAEAFFAAGDVQGALRLLDGVDGDREAQMLAAKIIKFQKVYNDALAEYRAQSTASALKLLVQAKALEAKVSGGDTKLAQEIATKLADMHYLEAVQAMQANRLPEAYRSLRGALLNVADHAQAKTKLQELSAKARELYQQGYLLRESNPGAARDKWMLVLQIISSDDDLYEKTKKRLETLK